MTLGPAIVSLGPRSAALALRLRALLPGSRDPQSRLRRLRGRRPLRQGRHPHRRAVRRRPPDRRPVRQRHPDPGRGADSRRQDHRAPGRRRRRGRLGRRAAPRRSSRRQRAGSKDRGRSGRGTRRDHGRRQPLRHRPRCATAGLDPGQPRARQGRHGPAARGQRGPADRRLRRSSVAHGRRPAGRRPGIHGAAGDAPRRRGLARPARLPSTGPRSRCRHGGRSTVRGAVRPGRRGPRRARAGARQHRLHRLPRPQGRRTRRARARRQRSASPPASSPPSACSPRPLASLPPPRSCSARPAAGVSPKVPPWRRSARKAASWYPSARASGSPAPSPWRRTTCMPASIGRPQGRLAVVGLGPGDLRWRTGEAQQLAGRGRGAGRLRPLSRPDRPRRRRQAAPRVPARCRGRALPLRAGPRRRGPQRGPGLLRRSRHLRPGDAGVRATGERRRSRLGARRRHRQPRRLRPAGGGGRRRRTPRPRFLRHLALRPADARSR